MDFEKNDFVKRNGEYFLTDDAIDRFFSTIDIEAGQKDFVKDVKSLRGKILSTLYLSLGNTIKDLCELKEYSFCDQLDRWFNKLHDEIEKEK